MERIPELSGFENLRVNTSLDSHRSLFKRSINMRDDDHSNNDTLLYKR